MNRLYAGLTMGLALLLGACNMPLSEVPLVPPGSTDTLAIRNGDWLLSGNGREERFRIAGDRWLTESATVPAAAKDLSEFAIANGDPAILQVSSSAPDKDSGYMFAALEVVSRDAAGALTGAKMWPILCHPPQRDEQAAAPPPNFPGMAKREGDNCRPADLGALRLAAQLSRPFADVTKLSFAGPPGGASPP